MRLRTGDVVRHSFLMTAMVITLAPLFFTLLTALKFRRDIISGRFFDFTPTWNNFLALFEGSRGLFGEYTLNSLIAGVGSTILVVAIAALAAYALSRFQWSKWLSGVLLAWLLFVYMLPPITFAGPYYVISRAVGLYDTPWVLVFAHAVITLPFAVWLLQSFFAEVPKELEEAAYIDGATNVQAFFQIVLPVVRGGLVATAILTFIFSWKDFLFALILTSTPEGSTIPVGIAGFVQEYDLKYGEMSAAAILATIPGVIMIMFAQRHIIKGMTMGALKG